MSVPTPKPRRRRTSVPRVVSEDGLSQESPAEATPGTADRSDTDERAAAAQTAENNPGHGLEQTLEALAVDEKTARRIQKLPHDVGWLLVTAGVVGVVMPGVLGVPFLVLGGLILWPGTNRRAEHWLNGHSPKIFKGSVRQINRFLDDLERRYPQVDKRENT